MTRILLKFAGGFAAVVALLLLSIWIIQRSETKNSTLILCEDQFPGRRLSEDALARLIELLPTVKALCQMKPYDYWKLKHSIPLGFDAYHPPRIAQNQQGFFY